MVKSILPVFIELDELSELEFSIDEFVRSKVTTWPAAKDVTVILLFKSCAKVSFVTVRFATVESALTANRASVFSKVVREEFNSPNLLDN